MAFVSTKSPLELPHILELIACHLPLQDIRSCLLVNKLWSEEMKRHLHLRSTICMDGTDVEEAEKMIAKRRSGLDVVAHCIIFKNAIPFQNKIFKSVINYFGYNLSCLVVSGMPSQWTSSILYRVLSVGAPNLEKFVFLSSATHHEFVNAPWWARRQNYVSLAYSLKEISSESSPFQSFPKMKVLEWDEAGPVEIVDLYRLFPNLKTLKVMKVGSMHLNDLKSIFDIGNWRSLKYLEILVEEVDFELFYVLKGMGLKLLQFVFRYCENFDDNEILQDLFSEFLKSVAETLIRIDIRFIPVIQNPRPFDIVFPVLPKLQILKILSTSVSPFDIKNLNNMPNIKALAFSYAKLQEENQSALTIKSLDSVKVVLEHNDFLYKFCNPAHLSRLTLHPFKVTDEVLRKVITECTMLGKLEISFETFVPQLFPCDFVVTDSGITGIPKEDLDKITEEKCDCETLSSLRKHPWVGSLQHLTHFVIQTTSSQLSEKSVLYGLDHATTLWYYGIFTDVLDLQKKSKEINTQRGWDCKCDYTCDRCTDILIDKYDQDEAEEEEGGNNTGDEETGVSTSTSRGVEDKKEISPSEDTDDKEDDETESHEYFWPAADNNCHIDDYYFRFIEYIMDKYN